MKVMKRTSLVFFNFIYFVVNKIFYDIITLPVMHTLKLKMGLFHDVIVMLF